VRRHREKEPLARAPAFRPLRDAFRQMSSRAARSVFQPTLRTARATSAPWALDGGVLLRWSAALASHAGRSNMGWKVPPSPLLAPTPPTPAPIHHPPQHADATPRGETRTSRDPAPTHVPLGRGLPRVRVGDGVHGVERRRGHHVEPARPTASAATSERAVPRVSSRGGVQRADGVNPGFTSSRSRRLCSARAEGQRRSAQVRA
jgi:hypothetical protein